MKPKPCPFCGSNAELRVVHPPLPNGKEDTLYLVRCTLRECQAATADWYPATAAVDAWNRRVQQPTATPDKRET